MQVPKERQPVAPQEVQLDKLLLVEGATAWHFFEALARHLQLSDKVEIRDYGGVTQLAIYLRLLAATASFQDKVKSLGIIRDAEQSAAAAKDSVNNAIAAAMLSPTVKVRMFIIPDDVEEGMIETVMQRSIEGTPKFGCVKQFFDGVSQCGFTLPPGVIASKHYIHVYVGTMPVKKMSSGIAAYEGAYPFQHTCFDSMKEFLRSL